MARRILVIDRGKPGTITWKNHEFTFAPETNEHMPQNLKDFAFILIHDSMYQASNHHKKLLSERIKDKRVIGVTASSPRHITQRKLYPMLYNVSDEQCIRNLAWELVDEHEQFSGNADDLARILRGSSQIDAALTALVILCKGYLITHAEDVRRSEDARLLKEVGWRSDQDDELKSLERKASTTESKKYWAPARLDSQSVERLEKEQYFPESKQAGEVLKLLNWISAEDGKPLKWDNEGVTIRKAYWELCHVLECY